MKRKATKDIQAAAGDEGNGTMPLSEVLDPRGGGCRPVIGITAALKEVAGPTSQPPASRFVRADLDYIGSVAAAGGRPVVLPPAIGLRAAEALLDGLDGLLLSGGSDLDPGYYGEGPMPELGATVPGWDAFDMALLRAALRRRIARTWLRSRTARPSRSTRTITRGSNAWRNPSR